MRYAQVILPVKLAWLPWYEVPDTALAGMTVAVGLAGKDYFGIIRNIFEKAPEGIAPGKIRAVNAVVEEAPLVAEQTLTFWEQIADYYLCSVGEVFKAAFHGWTSVESPKSRKAKSPKETESGQLSEAPTLSPEQDNALSGIRQAFAQHKNCLLEGVTGSGKTEIYLTLAREVLQQGKCVLYMVPEIALSRQLEARLRAQVGLSLRVFHSKETPARRTRLCRELSSDGEPLLVLGTRSSVFLPPTRFGLIIVDEEHDGSYKQDSPAPRYNGRDAALLLSRTLSCPVLLGSATPSLESRYNCEKGKMAHFILGEKYHRAEPADILLINTMEETRKNGMVGHFSRKLIEILQACLQEGKQAIILRSRKAYSPYVQCGKCGHIPKCKRCNLPLSYNKADGRLACHHCGKKMPYETVCPECGGPLLPMGAGTQKIEEEAAALFPQARISRLDSDAARSVIQERDIIEKFSRGETDILIGTQMVSKGFDFPGLKVVAVIDADALLSLDDFRADEKAVQTLEQLRGRCSRRDEKGLFVIQTRQATHPVFDCLREGITLHRPRLMDERKDFSYPPYTRLIDLTLEDFNEARMREKAARLAARLSAEGYDCLGPFAKGSGKTAGRYALCLRITFPKNRDYPLRKQALARTLDSFAREEKYNYNLSINVDPL
ncbi:MAG: primosomal protein N' [Bacteroidales bacterium]|nr:primosomal protein N' [Bacteroidales bacterium]